MKKKKSNKKCRALSIAAKLSITTNLLVIISCIALGAFIYFKISDLFLEQIRTNVVGIAQISAAQIDGDLLEQIQEGMEGTPEYEKSLEPMKTILLNDQVEYIYTMRKQGNDVIFVTDADEEEPAGIGELYEEVSNEMLKAFSGSAEADHEITSDKWSSAILGYAPVQDSDGKIVGIVGVDYSADDVMSKLSSLRTMIILITIICTLVCVLLNTLIVLKITQNLRKVITKMDDVLHSDKDLTKKIQMRSGDEIEIIAELTNEFVGMIRQMVADISEAAKSVQSGSVSTNSNAKLVHKNIADISDAMKSISSMLEENTNSIMSIGNSSDDTNQKTGIMFEDAKTALTYSDEMKTRAYTLKNSAAEMKSRCSSKVDIIEENISEKLEEAKTIEEITRISKEIIGISGRTNMLSLNASIEAARAGEAGKGFSVVAKQISDLADSTKTAAEQIMHVSEDANGIVRNLESAINEVLEFIQNEVLPDYETFLNAGETYHLDSEKILTLIQKFNEETKNVKEATTTIQNSVSDISAFMEEGTASMHTLNQNAADVNEASEEMEAVSNESLQMAEKLIHIVGAYKI